MNSFSRNTTSFGLAFGAFLAWFARVILAPFAGDFDLLGFLADFFDTTDLAGDLPLLFGCDFDAGLFALFLGGIN
jgi:hypothetical protein